MKKKELIAMLEHVKDDEEIVIEVPTHNYWGQMKAMPIKDIRAGVVAHCDYINGDQILDPKDQEKIVIANGKGEEVQPPDCYGPDCKAYYGGHPVREVRVLF